MQRGKRVDHACCTFCAVQRAWGAAYMMHGAAGKGRFELGSRLDYNANRNHSSVAALSSAMTIDQSAPYNETPRKCQEPLTVAC